MRNLTLIGLLVFNSLNGLSQTAEQLFQSGYVKETSGDRLSAI